ncbi:chromobox protein homolog 5 [Rhizophagus clarus]|uniref:Chromobox protein homolog 5 n=1 Tax=Rhizophagus clarus TaxID=94130 RepID=A0A8H3LQR7_9GLOM|nr:chromobox protein homolog 5 [Rhizophagus clarus]
MPIDPKGYHYFLIVVEISRRRVDAEPIKNKTANSILKAFIKIYGRSCIQPPTHRLETDSGSEFTNSQIRDFFLNSIGVMIRFGEPGCHKQQSYAERAIQAIQEPFLKRMTAQELKTEGPPKIDKNTELLLEGTLVQTKLLEPISVLGKKYMPPPDSVIRGQPERYVPEKILNHRTRKDQLQYLVKWKRYPEDKSTWEPADRLQEDVPNLEMYTDIARFLDVSPKWIENWLNTSTSHIVNTSFERTDIFQIHEIARNIIYHLDQLAEEDYQKAVEDYKNSGEELDYAYTKCLANGLDPYEISTWFGEPEEPIWQPDYWRDKDTDDPANWQSEYSSDPSDSDEDPNYPYLESVEWI